MGTLGKLNIYVCDTCRGHIVTRDVDEGVTPFMTNCKAAGGCKGTMLSSMYRVFDQSMAESHQWFRPARETWITYPRHTRDHLEKGGLLLREAAEPMPPEKVAALNNDARVADLKAKFAAAQDQLDPIAEKLAELEKRAISRQQRRAAERAAQKEGRKGDA